MVQLAEMFVPEAFKHFNETVQREDFAFARPELDLRDQLDGLAMGSGSGGAAKRLHPLVSDPGYTPNAYGLGLHSDAYGRPFRFETDDGSQAFGPVRLNAYGLGVHEDQFGRPVRGVRQ